MSSPNKKPPVSITPIDQLGRDELDARVAATLVLIAQARALWPGLTRMPEAERRASPGKALSAFVGPLGLLFSLLAPAEGEPPALAKAFDVLGSQDGGVDPDRFEADLLAVRVYRAEAQQKIVDALDDLSRHIGDDILSIGEKVLGPGLLALELSRTLSKANPEYASLLAPVLDAFRDLTKPARKALEAKRAALPADPQKPTSK